MGLLLDRPDLGLPAQLASLHPHIWAIGVARLAAISVVPSPDGRSLTTLGLSPAGAAGVPTTK
jgi:hypothetical protein